eukprot:6208364-Pleurochrysis_carterae.AAC.4
MLEHSPRRQRMPSRVEGRLQRLTLTERTAATAFRESVADLLLLPFCTAAMPTSSHWLAERRRQWRTERPSG